MEKQGSISYIGTWVLRASPITRTLWLLTQRCQTGSSPSSAPGPHARTIAQDYRGQLGTYWHQLRNYKGTNMGRFTPRKESQPQLPRTLVDPGLRGSPRKQSSTTTCR